MANIADLASAAVARIREIPVLSDHYLTLREKCYGLGVNETDGRLERKGQGAFDGSIDKWIEILSYVANLPVTESRFLSALQLFLNGKPTLKPEAVEKPELAAKGEAKDNPAPQDSTATMTAMNLSQLVEAWKRACDVPATIIADKVDAKNALKIVNAFRNRFAHVPFPYDRLAEIHRHLEKATFDLFEIAPSAVTPESALCGGIADQSFLLRGSTLPEVFPEPFAEQMFVFGYKRNNLQVESWPS